VIADDFQEEFDALYAAIRSYIFTNGLEKTISVSKEDNVLIIRFREVLLFDSGKADILYEGEVVINHIVSIIEENVGAIKMLRVEGHTDNVPMYNAEFQSNWELSAIRAVNFLEILVGNERIDPLLFSTKAYGDNLPIESNDTVEGRDKNRRVEVLIQPLVLKDGSAFE